MFGTEIYSRDSAHTRGCLWQWVNRQVRQLPVAAGGLRGWRTSLGLCLWSPDTPCHGEPCKVSRADSGSTHGHVTSLKRACGAPESSFTAPHGNSCASQAAVSTLCADRCLPPSRALGAPKKPQCFLKCNFQNEIPFHQGF